MLVNWDPPVVTNGFITQYNVWWQAEDGSQSNEIALHNPTQNYEFTDLTECEVYTFYVAAGTTGGYGLPATTLGSPMDEGEGNVNCKLVPSHLILPNSLVTLANCKHEKDVRQ